MKGKKWHLILVICLGLLEIQAQEIKNSSEYAKNFFEYVTEDGGIWMAENNTYSDTLDFGFPYFLIEFQKDDSLSVHLQIKGIASTRDTFLFWDAWEFYVPGLGKAKLIQRSPNGIYLEGYIDYPSASDRKGDMVIVFPDGKKVKHKDTHIVLSKNEMKSASYDYNEKDEKWVPSGEALWQRQCLQKINKNN